MGASQWWSGGDRGKRSFFATHKSRTTAGYREKQKNDPLGLAAGSLRDDRPLALSKRLTDPKGVDFVKPPSPSCGAGPAKVRNGQTFMQFSEFNSGGNPVAQS